MRTYHSQLKIWPQMAYFANMRFFPKTPNVHVTLDSFQCSKLKNKKKWLEPIQSYEVAIISNPKWVICPEEGFFSKKPLI